MARGSPVAAPCCLTQTPLPQTLSALRQEAQLTEAGARFEPLALLGTAFRDALITTQNSAALISGRGGYGAFQTSAMPLRLSRGRHRMDMRFDVNTPVNVVRSEASEDALPSVVALDSGGRVQHRVQLLLADEVAAAQNLPHEAICNDAPAEDIAENVIPLTAIRNAMGTWDRGDHGQHLNDFLRDRGVARYRCLPHLGANRAWPVLADMLPSFLDYLGTEGISYARFVVGSGLLHSDVGVLGQLQCRDHVMIVRYQAASFAVDLKHIGSIWVTAFGGQCQLEMFDRDGHGVAVLAGDPHRHTCRWNTLLASLPRLWSRHPGGSA